MEEDVKTVAFFDFEGTLFVGHFWQGIVKHHIKHKVKRLSVAAYLATHILLWLAHKIKIISEEEYKVKWGEDLATLLKGLMKEEVQGIFDWICSNYVMKLLRPDIMELLQQHRAAGHVIVLLSGCFDGFLDTIKQRLGLDYIVGTKLEVRNDVYSGRIVEPLCFGINKVRLLKEFISQTQLNVDHGLSFAYADSIIDASILEMVGNPVATYPDKKLLNLAQHKGWQILPSPVFMP